MTMQIAVAAMFGIGLLTVATISLLNFVCLRLFEVQKKDEEIEDVASQQMDTDSVPSEEDAARCRGDVDKKRRLTYAYVYDGPKSCAARRRLRCLPPLVGWVGFAAGLALELYVIHVGWTNDRLFGGLPDSVWITIATLVFFFLAAAAVASARVYDAIAEANVE